jgi:CTP:phosphocholine cytidylyltransferase-like protein
MINKEINELRMKIHNIKEEVIQEMENLRKKNKIEMQNKWKAIPQTKTSRRQNHRTPR